MPDEVTRRITYRGDPALVGELLRTCEEEGLTVQRVGPTSSEQRDVVFSATGTMEKIKSATGKMRHRVGGRADVAVEGEDS